MLRTRALNRSSFINLGFVGFGRIVDSFIGLLNNGFKGESEFCIVDG